MENRKLQPESLLEQKQRVVERFIKMSRILEQPDAGGETTKEVEAAIKDMPPEEKALRLYESLVTYNLEKRAQKDKSNEEKYAADPYFISEFKQLWADKRARRIFLKKFSEARADLIAYRLSGLGSQLREIEGSIHKTRNEYAKLKQDLNLQRLNSPTAVKAAKAKLEYQNRRLEELSNNESKIVNLEGYEHSKENTDVAALIMYETLKRYQKEAKTNFVWLPSRQEIHKKVNDVIEHMGKAPLLIGPPGTGKTTQINAVARERTGTDAIRIPCHPGLSEEGLIYVRDIKAGEGVYDYKGTITEAATGYENSLAKMPAVDHGRMVSLDEIYPQLSLDRALGPLKDIRQARVGQPLSRFAPYKVLPGFQLAATSNMPIADERLDREFARIPTNYFEMTPGNPELYEFMLAKLLREEGGFPIIDKRDVEPAYEKQDIPEADREKLKDGSIVVAMGKLVENPADARHGFLYRFTGTVRAIQDSYIHGSQFNEKHLANTAMYEDYDGSGNLIIKGYVTNLADRSQSPGGQMLKLKFGSSTITAEIVSKWTEGFAQGPEKDMKKWFRQMLQEHIDQTSPEDAERVKAIADYFHIFDESPAGPFASAEPLTPKEIGYLSPRVPRPLYVEKPAKVEKSEAYQNERPSEKNLQEVYTTKKVVLENGETVIIQESTGSFGNTVNEAVDINIGTKMVIDGKRLEFAGTVSDRNSQFNGALVGRIVGEDLYVILDSGKIAFGILEEFVQSSGVDIENAQKDIEQGAFV